MVTAGPYENTQTLDNPTRKNLEKSTFSHPDRNSRLMDMRHCCKNTQKKILLPAIWLVLVAASAASFFRFPPTLRRGSLRLPAPSFSAANGRNPSNRHRPGPAAAQRRSARAWVACRGCKWGPEWPAAGPAHLRASRTRRHRRIVRTPRGR